MLWVTRGDTRELRRYDQVHCIHALSCQQYYKKAIKQIQ